MNPLRDVVRDPRVDPTDPGLPRPLPEVRIRRAAASRTPSTHARYPWRLSSTARIRMLGKDFGHALDGSDVIEFNNDGTIKKVVSFIGSSTDE